MKDFLPRSHYAMTLEEVAQVLGISRGRVFQLEQNALRKLARKLSHLREEKGSDAG